MNYSPPGSSAHGVSQARILECCNHFLLQGIFPIQRLKLHFVSLLHRQVGSLPLSHLESQEATEVKSQLWWTSLAVQWLRLQASTTGAVGSIPGQGTKIPYAEGHG